MQASRAEVKERMDTPNEIIEAFGREDTSLMAAYRAANEHRQAAVPAFIEYIEATADANDLGRASEFEAVFWLLCMLAEWRETRAYRPVARLFRCDPQFLDDLMDNAISENCHRFMASVFDEDLDVLFDIIRDEKADEYVRSGMFDTLTIIGIRQPEHRDTIKEFAREFATSHFSEAPDYVWCGWVLCIAYLGFEEMKPLVRYMFSADRITDDIMEFRHFEEDLEKGLDPERREKTLQDKQFSLWDDTLDFIPTEHEGDEKPLPPSTPNNASSLKPNIKRPQVAPVKIGRNDPCPCGSGKKYKNCCLRSH